jgi:tetratricopeptide (TPR) repeat protein
VLVLQNLGLSWIPRWHYAVVIGYDLTEKTLTLHSGETARREIDWSLFIRTWKRADAWAVLALPPGKLPETAREVSYVNAVIGLEQAGRWQDAADAYTAALNRWPGSLGALVGLGNCRYEMGNLEQAERAFRRALNIAPKNAAACNNLAHVLAEEGQYEEALQMARRAVSLGGKNQPLYRKTLAEIEKGVPRRN